MSAELLRRRRPCDECPWRKDTPPGKFPAERYEALEATAGPEREHVGGREAPLGSPLFACHKSQEGGEVACAGWLAVCGADHIGVRLMASCGQVPPEALQPGDDWPDLFDTYDEMAAAQGRR